MITVGCESEKRNTIRIIKMSTFFTCRLYFYILGKADTIMGCISEITGQTRLTGLLGSPVSHSKSPLMHNEAYRLLGLDYVYLCFDVPENNLQVAFEGLKKLNVAGFNCTMPDKTLMSKLVDELSPAAKIISAVNTVVNDNGKFVGHNTDGTGYIRSLQDCGHNIVGKKMTLLGSGGAASSICVQAALDGAREIDVLSIKDNFWSKAEKLVSDINNNTDCKVNLIEMNDDSIGESVFSSDILTNATPIGMAPNTDGCLVKDSSILRPELIVSDIIYNPLETKLYKMAKEKGCSVFNGLYMLLYQGAEAFYLWTGKKMPTEEIKAKYFD